MKGLSLIQGAHLGLKLLVRSPQIFTINIVSDVVLTVGKIAGDCTVLGTPGAPMLRINPSW